MASASASRLQPPASDPEIAGAHRGRFTRFARTFVANPGAVVGAIILALLIVGAILGPRLEPYDPDAMASTALLTPPDAAHVLGTDEYGRDEWSRVLDGAHLSLTVGLVSVAIASLVGSSLGLVSGYFGGLVDGVIMRLIDVKLAFPGIILAIGIVAVLGPSLTNVMIAVGIAGIGGYARVVRGTVLASRELAYVEAARCLGCDDLRIMVRHILPNVLAPVIVLASLGIAGAILTAAGLSFIGLGAQPPTPEWGAMLSDGHNYIAQAWWLTVFPGLAMMVTVLAINLVGDGLRDALDPRLRV